jgi:hypothetical protein
MDVVAEQSLNREKKRAVYAVFDLPTGVEPPVAGGERREMRGRVRTSESERGE